MSKNLERVQRNGLELVSKLATYYDVLCYPKLLKATKYLHLFISKSEYR